MRLALPGQSFCGDVKGAPIQLDIGVESPEVADGRNLAVLHRHHGLDDSRHPGRAFQVPDIGLHRAERAMRLRGRKRVGTLFLPLRKSSLQSIDLNRIAERSARSVSLD